MISSMSLIFVCLLPYFINFLSIIKIECNKFFGNKFLFPNKKTNVIPNPAIFLGQPVHSITKKKTRKLSWPVAQSPGHERVNLFIVFNLFDVFHRLGWRTVRNLIFNFCSSIIAAWF